jgi:hypothetical protein
LYVTYCHVLKTAGRTCLSHYDYRKAYALAWIDKDGMKMHERKKWQWANQKAQAATRTEGKEETELTTTPTSTPASSSWKTGRPSSAASNKSQLSLVKKKMRTNTYEPFEVLKKGLSITDETLHTIFGSSYINDLTDCWIVSQNLQISNLLTELSTNRWWEIIKWSIATALWSVLNAE